MRRWSYLSICTIAMLLAGVIYAWSILKAPLAEEFRFSATALSVNYTLTFCFFCAGGIVNGRIKYRMSIRNRFFLAAALILAGFFLASCMQSVWLLYAGYGILGGFGIGILYSNLVSEMTLWFQDRPGVCSGILMMGFGASAMLLGSPIQALISHPAVGWRDTYRFLGAAICVISIVTGFIVGGEKKRPDHGHSAKGTRAGEADIPPGRMIRMASFWAIFFRGICTGCAGSVIINFSRELGLAMGASMAMATAVVGILSVCNGLGRLVFGFLFDLLGYKRTIWISNGISLLAMALIYLAYRSHSVEIFVAGVVMIGCAYGSMPTISSAIVSDFYGSRFFTQNFSIMNFTLVASSLLVIASSLLLDYFGSYTEPLCFLLMMIAVGCILTFFIRKPAPVQNFEIGGE